MKTDDFKINGSSKNAAWDKAEWCSLTARGRGKDDSRVSRFKMLYSKTGLYVLMEGQDRALTVTDKADFDDLWTEDVFEFFLWPDERWPVYFEYEISPHGRELVLLVPNFGGRAKQYGWRPWHYEGKRKVEKAIHYYTERTTSGEEFLYGWSAEVFVPYELLKPLQNVPPKSGTHWRANVYRCDYDRRPPTAWSWRPTKKSFHDFKKFGTLVFE